MASRFLDLGRRSCIIIIALSLMSFIIPKTRLSAREVTYGYDELNRLTRVAARGGSMLLTYTYDEVGNRLSMTAQGISLDIPEVTDTGLFGLDNTTLGINVTTYGEQYGDLDYEYAIGTSAETTDAVDWSSFQVAPDGTATVSGFKLPYNQEYFISVRIKNFRGDIVSAASSSDGITVLDPVADPDEDGSDNQSEIMAGSNPFNPESYPALTTVHLRPGFNLIAIPTEVVYQPDLRNWLPAFGDSSETEKVMVYDDEAGKFVTLIPGEQSAEGLMLMGGEGLIVYAKQDKEITFSSILCPNLDLKPGFNLVGIACPEDGYSAYQLLNDLASENVSSIQRYSSEKGAFETASFGPNGQPTGVDFTIVAGEGYFIYRK
jgi:YD repeat-containing protein